MPIEIGDYVTLELAEGGFIGGQVVAVRPMQEDPLNMLTIVQCAFAADDLHLLEPEKECLDS